MNQQEARGHDPSYKRIFSHPYMVRTLLESFVEPDETLSKYSPALQFVLIDAGALDPDVLDHMHNACAQLLRLEQLDDPEALLEHAARLVQLIHSALPQPVREDLAIWLSELLRSAKIDAPVRTILDKESSPMIYDTVRRFEAHFTQKGLQQGIERGLLRGKRETAAKQLLLKFGSDDTRAAWMEALSAAQLDLLTELLLSANDEPALRAQIDAHNPG